MQAHDIAMSPEKYCSNRKTLVSHDATIVYISNWMPLIAGYQVTSRPEKMSGVKIAHIIADITRALPCAK